MVPSTTTVINSFPPLHRIDLCLTCCSMMNRLSFCFLNIDYFVN